MCAALKMLWAQVARTLLTEKQPYAQDTSVLSCRWRAVAGQRRGKKTDCGCRGLGVFWISAETKHVISKPLSDCDVQSQSSGTWSVAANSSTLAMNIYIFIHIIHIERAFAILLRPHHRIQGPPGFQTVCYPYMLLIQPDIVPFFQRLSWRPGPSHHRTPHHHPRSLFNPCLSSDSA